jgi:hypothetical protein
MKEKVGEKKEKKGFFSRMLDKLDKKMEVKAKENKCCSGSDKGKSCCS